MKKLSTVAAISTAQGSGGIGVVRISGENALKIADKVFCPYIGNTNECLQNLGGYRAKYGRVMHKGEFIDDAVALVFKAPHSYTGEDVVEISCHGGMYLTKTLLRAIIEAGALPAAPGEFTKRAFLNGKMDLSQAEAVMDLISARSERANKIAFSMHEGNAGKKINKIKEKIIDLIANLSVWADYPEEEDTPEINEQAISKSLNLISFKIQNIIKNYDVGKALKDGVKTAIIGCPNVGKSTLMNLLAGYEKSIVTNIPGTTRDVLEETVMIGDIPLLLVDTAGIRETEDIIEQIGVKKAKDYIHTSDLTLLVLDASSPISEKDMQILNLCDKNKTIIILNKCDLGKKIDESELLTFCSSCVELSALNGTGIDKLKSILEDMVGLSKIEASDVVISNERQLNSLQKAQNLLEKAITELSSGVTLDAITVLLQDAINVFMEFTGENSSEAVVNKVFSKFCVGK